jgi:aryl-alcohol dehydrogenase-like predicted oxidoreductase
LTQNPGKGVLVKRALAGLAWTRQTRPDWDGSFCESQYFDRWQALTSAGLHDFGMDWDELALRLSAHQAGVNSVLLGTKTPANLKRAIQLVQRGPLPPEALEQIQTCWRKAGGEAWPGII